MNYLKREYIGMLKIKLLVLVSAITASSVMAQSNTLRFADTKVKVADIVPNTIISIDSNAGGITTYSSYVDINGIYSCSRILKTCQQDQQRNVLVDNVIIGKENQTISVSVTYTGSYAFNRADIIAGIQVPDILSVNQSTNSGIGPNMRITGLFYGGDESYRLNRSEELITSNDYSMHPNGTYGRVIGYNYTQSHQDLSVRGINFNQLTNGIIVFNNGLVGRILVTSNGGVSSGERAFIYYDPAVAVFKRPQSNGQMITNFID